MRGRPQYEVSPSSANLHEVIPPPFAGEIRPPFKAMFVYLDKIRPTEIKYAEKTIIVEVVDRYIDDPRSSFFVSRYVSANYQLATSTCLLCGDLDSDAVWEAFTVNGEQTIVDKQWGMAVGEVNVDVDKCIVVGDLDRRQMEVS